MGGVDRGWGAQGLAVPPGSAAPSVLSKAHPVATRFGDLQSVCVPAGGGLCAPPRRGFACKEAAGEGSERASASVINRARSPPLRALEECIAATPPSCQAGIIWIMLLSGAGVPHGDGERGWASGNPSIGNSPGMEPALGTAPGTALPQGARRLCAAKGTARAWGHPLRMFWGPPRLARGSPGPSGAVRCPGWAGGFGGAQAAAPGEVDEVVSPVDPAGEDNLASNQFFKCAQLKDCL